MNYTSTWSVFVPGKSQYERESSLALLQEGVELSFSTEWYDPTVPTHITLTRPFFDLINNGADKYQ